MGSLTLRRPKGPSRRVLIEEDRIFPHPVSGAHSSTYAAGIQKDLENRQRR
jgi:hypothetical protein